MYLGAAQNLCLPPERIAIVAAHMGDIRGAATHGMRTVYVRRPTEDLEERDMVKLKSEGGEVDVIVDSLVELAQLVKRSQE
jgi:FMN phosphatase YigB (HAD superfamily)